MQKPTYDLTELKSFLLSECIEVPVLMGPITEKVIDAEKLLIKMTELCNMTQPQFQEYINGVNKANFDDSRDKIIDDCIKGICMPGVFKLHGYEKLGKKPWIHLTKILEQLK